MKMKKLAAAVLTVSMLGVLALTGCGSDKGNEQQSAANADASTGYVFDADGVEVAVDADAAAVVEKLGEADSYFEEPSCAGQGMTKIYTYPGYQIHTYEVGGKDLIERIVLMDDTVATAEGVDLSMTRDDVTENYGDDYTGTDNTIVYEKGGMKLSFVLDGDVVISIEYVSNNAA